MSELLRQHRAGILGSPGQIYSASTFANTCYPWSLFPDMRMTLNFSEKPTDFKRSFNPIRGQHEGIRIEEFKLSVLGRFAQASPGYAASLQSRRDSRPEIIWAMRSRTPHKTR